VPPARQPLDPTPGADDPLDQGTLLFLVGCTASGKSALAPEVARRAGAEVLSLDSMLVYRGMDVGTAKPTEEERGGVAHHLIDVAEPSERFHVQRYVELAREAVRGCRARGVLPLFVGGTPLYMRALIHGLFDAPPHDATLRDALVQRARDEGAPALHAELERLDPRSAARVHPNDAKRVVRALEVLRQTGRPLADWQREWAPGGREAPGRRRRIAGLAPEPAELERRIPARTRALFEAGWVEEARRVRSDPGFGPTAIQALGYREVLAHADGDLGRAECEERVNVRTRQLARRQRTWFRRFPEIEWVPAGTRNAREQVLTGVLQGLG